MNNEGITKRAIESVLDTRTGKEIFASEFFNKADDEIFRIRYEVESGIREEKPTYICYYCKQAIKIIGKADSKRILHFAHKKDSDDCHIKTNNKLSKDEICRIKYNGEKESELHIELKTFIANSLLANKDNENGIECVEIEKIKKHETIPNVWKKPDISSIYKNKSVVFELQLSTTFLSVINSRQEFYRDNHTYLIWIFNLFETDNEKRKFTQSDVFYNNNRNGFELNECAKEKSRIENDLILHCYYEKPSIKSNNIIYEWVSEYIKLSDLTFDENSYKVYYFDVLGVTRELEIKLKVSNSLLVKHILNEYTTTQLINLFISGYHVKEIEIKTINEHYKMYVEQVNVIESNSMQFKIILAIILIKIEDKELINEFIDDYRLRKTVFDILSLKLNKIIGYLFDKQIRISHRLLDDRPEHMELYLLAIKKYRPNLIAEEDHSNKMKNKINKIKQLNIKQTFHKLIITKVFPDLTI